MPNATAKKITRHDRFHNPTENLTYPVLIYIRSLIRGAMDKLSAGDSSGTDDRVETALLADHASLKYSLLGPSLTKAGQDAVDQSTVRLVSLGSCFCFYTGTEDADTTYLARSPRLFTTRPRGPSTSLGRRRRIKS